MPRPIPELVAINDQALKANRVAHDGLRRAANAAEPEEEERIVARLARARLQFGNLAMIGVHLRAATVQVLDIPQGTSDRLEELARLIDDQILRDAQIHFAISVATDLLNKSGEILSLLRPVTPTPA